MIIRHIVDRYTPRESLSDGLLQKFFGIAGFATFLALIFRSVLGGKSLNTFEDNWNKDRYCGVIAGYRKRLTHALLSRNLLRFGTQTVRITVMGVIKNLQTKGKLTLNHVAIDSTKVLAQGKTYPKTGWAKIHGKYSFAY